MDLVLFVCTGNYYRSRFSEIYLNHYCQQQQLPCQAFSRGFNTMNNGNVGPLSVHAIHELNKRNIPLPGTRRYPLRLKQHDLWLATQVVLIKETEHRPMIQRAFPEWENKVTYWQINDIEDEAPATAIDKLETQLKQLLASIQQQ